MDDRVSVVMITRNRGDQVQLALQHLLDLPERPRLIVVDNDSSDGTVEAARSLGTQIEVLSPGQNLGGAGRNVGVLSATTPYVAFSDDDSWWHAGALSQAANIFDANPSLGLLAARILVGPEESLDPLSHAMATSPLADSCERAVGIPVVGFAACGAVVRRLAFLEAGGFEQRFEVGGEEQVLALDMLRLGWRLAYVDDVVAHHHPSPARDPARRKHYEVRNALWSIWLRRPAVSAWNETWRLLKSSLRDPARRAGIKEAVSGLPWVLSAREPVPPAIDRQLQLAEEAWRAGLGI